MRGGYLVIDLNNISFSNGVGIVVKNCYDRIESTRKPVRLCNVVVDEIEIRDIELINLHSIDSSFQATFTIGGSDISVMIEDTDVITFSFSG